MRLKKYEIRMSVSKNLYDHISQEAKWRDTNMANIVREQLAKYYFQHERIANPLETTNTQQENYTNKTSTPTMETEKKLFSGITKIEKRFELIQEQMKFVITMIDRFYFDLMKFLPNIPDKLILAARSIGHQRHTEWLETIEKILKMKETQREIFTLHRYIIFFLSLAHRWSP